MDFKISLITSVPRIRDSNNIITKFSYIKQKIDSIFIEFNGVYYRKQGDRIKEWWNRIEITSLAIVSRTSIFYAKFPGIEISIHVIIAVVEKSCPCSLLITIGSELVTLVNTVIYSSRYEKVLFIYVIERCCRHRIRFNWLIGHLAQL